jgi:tetratricopeptide (TPR) repeat protein
MHARSSAVIRETKRENTMKIQASHKLHATSSWFSCLKNSLLLGAMIASFACQAQIPSAQAFDSDQKKEQKNLWVVTKMSLDKLKKELPQDYKILALLTLLNTQRLEKDLIKKLYEGASDTQIKNFDRIAAMSLVLPAGTKDAHDTYRIHDYTKEVLTTELTDQEQLDAAALGASVFSKMLPKKVDDAIPFFEKNPTLSMHLQHFVQHLDMMPPEEALSIGVKLFHYTFYFARRYDFAAEFSTHLAKLVASDEVKDPLLIATFHSVNSGVKLILGTLEEAVNEALLAREAFKRLDTTKDNQEYVRLLANNLAFFYYWRGDAENALRFVKEAEVVQGTSKEGSGPMAIDIIYAVLAQDRGDYAGSLAVLDRLDTLTSKNPQINKVAGHYIKGLRVASLLKMGKTAEAYEVITKAHAHAIECTGGQEHADIVGRALIYRSQCESLMGKETAAEVSARKAIAIFADVFKGEGKNRRQAVAYTALGDALMAQKRFTEAMIEYGRAEKTYKDTCSHLAFDDVSELYAKILSAAIKTHDHDKADAAIAQHQALFPSDHPRQKEIQDLYKTM